MAYQHSLLIGGIGDDAHSVGIGLLALGFKEAGFFVRNLGIRNKVSTFFDLAGHFDIVMISNKNGHAELYLEDFPRLLHNYQLNNGAGKLWYLGGSLSVSESDYFIKKKFLGMGFTNVYPRPVSFEAILNDIREDALRYNIAPKQAPGDVAGGYERIRFDPLEISDQKWSKEFLNKQRVNILHEWNNGRDKRMSVATVPNKTHNSHSLDLCLWRNHVEYQAPLLQPRTGVADIEQQISKLKYLERVGSNISSVQLDAASRSKLYDHAKQGVEMSVARQKSLLNGFPVPVYGIKETNRMIRALNTPFQLRAGGPDHRFTYEIALLAGASGLEGGFICYLMPYDKLTSPAESLLNWQYVDRLCSLYEEEHGICINREYFGTLTASLIEPSLPIVVNIIQAILSAKQGVKSISVGYAEQGNRVQDVAAMQVLPEMTNKYLNLFGCKGSRVTTVFHQFMAAFPSDYGKAEELIVNSSITATLACATKIMVKTPVEALKIPDRYDNEKALSLCRKGIAQAKGLGIDHQLLIREKALLRLEVTQLMERILELGNGAVALGAIRAVEEGLIDVPWSPNIYNKNQVVTIRDTTGAVRFLHFGNLPFTEDIKHFHAEKIYFRKMMERDSSTFSLLEKDLTRIWKNDYKQWPLDDTYIT